MDKTFERHGISANPLPFIFHLDNVYNHEDYYFPNWHLNIELLYFISGSGTVLYDDKPLEVREGDIVLIGSNISHAFYSDIGMKYYCLIPDSSFCRFNGIESDALKFTPLVRNDEETKRLFSNVVSEFTGTTPFREAGICSAVMSLLLHVIRNHTKNVSSVLPPSSEEGVRLAVSYISANFSEKISIDMLAQISGFSKYHFLREFKRITGETPIVFLNRTRCENAKHMLRTGAFSIKEVSAQCGFEDLSYFGKIFKNFCGVTPKQYMSEIKQ